MTGRGYEFVSLSDTVRRVERRAARHDRQVEGCLSGVLDVRFLAEQPVHVGSGRKRLVDGNPVRGGFASSGRPGLPGSTIKGVLRSRLEAISDSCIITGGSGPHEAFRQCHHKSARLCLACAVFGRMSLRSRVAASDFLCANETGFELQSIPESFSPRRPRTLRGRKFAVGLADPGDQPSMQAVEVIPEGAVLCGELRILNLEPAEVGALMAALGASPASRLKVGGGKAHGLGRLRLESLKSRSPTALPVDLEGWRTAFEGSEDRHAEGERRLVELHHGGC